LYIIYDLMVISEIKDKSKSLSKISPKPTSKIKSVPPKSVPKKSTPSIPSKKKSDPKKSDSKKTDSKKSDSKKTDSKKSDSKKTDSKKSDSKKTDSKKTDSKKTDSKSLSKNKSVSVKKNKPLLTENKFNKYVHKNKNMKRLPSCLLNNKNLNMRRLNNKKSLKKVQFSPKVTVITFSKNDSPNPCILNPGIQNLIKECNLAHVKIAQLINKNSPHKILLPIENDNPVKVYDTGEMWWNDHSPVIMSSKLMNDKKFLVDFLRIFDHYLKKSHRVDEVKPLIINNKRLKIKFAQVKRVS